MINKSQIVIQTASDIQKDYLTIEMIVAESLFCEFTTVDNKVKMEIYLGDKRLEIDAELFYKAIRECIFMAQNL
jgi:hypothetical protein